MFCLKDAYQGKRREPADSSFPEAVVLAQVVFKIIYNGCYSVETITSIVWGRMGFG